MSGMTPSIDLERLHRDLEGMCQGALILFRNSKKLTGLGKNEISEVLLTMFNSTWDGLVDALAGRGGESYETAIANYYYAKALALAMGGEMRTGAEYISKAVRIRTGGVLWEWCQDYYSV